MSARSHLRIEHDERDPEGRVWILLAGKEVGTVYLDPNVPEGIPGETATRWCFEACPVPGTRWLSCVATVLEDVDARASADVATSAALREIVEDGLGGEIGPELITAARRALPG